jgi:hypothetical protein
MLNRSGFTKRARSLVPFPVFYLISEPRELHWSQKIAVGAIAMADMDEPRLLASEAHPAQDGVDRYTATLGKLGNS